MLLCAISSGVTAYLLNFKFEIKYFYEICQHFLYKFSELRFYLYLFIYWNLFKTVSLDRGELIDRIFLLSFNALSYPIWVNEGSSLWYFVICYFSRQYVMEKSSICHGSMKNILRSWISWRPWPGARPRTGSPEASTAGSPAPPALCSWGWPCS